MRLHPVSSRRLMYLVCAIGGCASSGPVALIDAPDGASMAATGSTLGMGDGGSGGTRAAGGGATGTVPQGVAGRNGAAGTSDPVSRTNAGGENGSAGDLAGAGVGSAGAGGAALQPYRGVASYNGCTDVSILKLAWYYNWTAGTNCASSAQFVPQLWGHAGENLAGELTTAAGHGYTAILGFNEPDNATQSHITVSAAIALWPRLTTNPAIRVGSPATQANATGQAWFTSFMQQVNADTTGKLRVDFIALHWYGWNAGSCEPSAATFENYIKWAEAIPGNRPIWITEWACMNASDPNAATVQSFLTGAIAMLARHPRVERYGWYLTRSSDANDLVTGTGTLTPLGTVYAAAPPSK